MSTKTSKSMAENNAKLLKSLLKLPSNKYCCDCKVADHPRWASWNLGIFLCIRCSGIHRSMGTHISRVKSVDLDAWTDEQTQSMVSWGNCKANKYWESKLEEGHVPSESKIDNFVKTKYVSKRWVATEQRPQPDDISDNEDSPTSALDRAKVLPLTRTSVQPATSTQNSKRTPAPVKETPDPTANQQSESLLGMDFSSPLHTNSGSSNQNDMRKIADVQTNLSLLSSSSSSTSAAKTTEPRIAPRNDLKTSIMSLYASAPKPQSQQSQQYRAQQPQGPSPGVMSINSAPHRPASAFDDLNGLFSGMNVQAAASSQRVQSTVKSIPNTQPLSNPSYQAPVQSGSITQLSGPSALPREAARWGNDDDAWTGFQSNTNSKPVEKQTSAFDDLYSTSVSTKHM